MRFWKRKEKALEKLEKINTGLEELNDINEQIAQDMLEISKKIEWIIRERELKNN